MSIFVIFEGSRLEGRKKGSDRGAGRRKEGGEGGEGREGGGGGFRSAIITKVFVICRLNIN